MFRKFVTMLAAGAVVMGSTGGAHAVTTLKYATLAPQDSAWGKEFKRLAKDISDDTGGELQVDYQWNGQAGDEIAMVQKIRSGQLDGAAIDAVGLAQTGVIDVLLFQMPGMFSNWAKLDSVRNAMKDDLNKQFEAKGFTVLGWGDVGAAKQMSIGFEVHRPADLQGKGTFYIAGDPVQPKFFSSIPGVTPKPVQVTDILPALSNGSVNAFVAPPYVAEQFQWASRVTHIGTQTVAFLIGANIISTARMQALPQKFKDVLTTRAAEGSGRLATLIRNLDAQAFARMKATKKSYDITEDEKKEWAKVFTKTAQQLRGTVFSAASFDRVVQLAQPPYELAR